MLHDVFMGLLTAYAAEHYRDLFADTRLFDGFQATLEGILAVALPAWAGWLERL